MQRKQLSMTVPAMKLFREQKGISLHGLAKRTGVSASNLGRIERGESSPRLNTAEAIAVALEKKLNEIWEVRF